MSLSNEEALKSKLDDAQAFIRELLKIQDEGQDDGFTLLVKKIILSIKTGIEDYEMQFRTELKNKYKLNDNQVNQKLLQHLVKEKTVKKENVGKSINLKEVEPLTYQMDGWLLEGDISLTYGSFGSGKTTHALYKAYKFAQGINILDRDAECKQGKTLFICTDGGVNTFKKAMNDLGLNEDDPIFEVGGKNQKIFVWGHDHTQGHKAWAADINGIIKLEEFVKQEHIDNVVIDSAKSVSSRAGWSYIDNESTRVFLQYLREIIAFPNKCHIDILSHDGTASGAHAGAKSWAEEPSMVICLKPNIDEDTKKQNGVTAEFKKDRAANIDPRRTVVYKLEDCEMVLEDEKEIVGSCNDVIIEILKDFYKQGQKEVRRADIVTTAFNIASAARKTVDNTLGNMVSSKQIRRPRKGVYALNPKDIQRLEQVPDKLSENTIGKSSNPSYINQFV